MKPPQWLAEKIAEEGALVLDGKKSRADADAVVTAATRNHPEFGEERGIAAALALFGKWVRTHTSSGDLFQAQPFPGLPASMLVAPKRAVQVTDMTAEDLDHAKNMLYARTRNAMKGAKDSAMRERASFDRFYDRVRPLLKDGLTVGDVLPEATAQAGSKAPAAAGAQKPAWFAEATEREGRRVLAGEISPEEASAHLVRELGAHPEFVSGLIRELASLLLDGKTPDEALDEIAEENAA